MSEVDAAGILLVNPDGRADVAVNADLPLIPASTAKLVLAWLALGDFGSKHQIETRFFVERMEPTAKAEDSTGVRLWVKAAGDPYLTSEELPELSRQLAIALRDKGIDRINSFGVDESLFNVIQQAPGGSRTSNPYDALPSALAANFNTVVVRVENGRVIRGEPQTPVTATAEVRARELGLLMQSAKPDSDNGKRVNLGFTEKHRPSRYLIELLSYFLQQQGIDVVGETVRFDNTVSGQALLSYRSSRQLKDITADMLTYSNNFIANQLALVWAASVAGGPASFDQFSHLAEQRLQQAFSWPRVSILEGAGLSRHNRLSARQLVDVIESLQVYDDLLPLYREGVYAKTGTLSGVSSLAGSIDAASLPGVIDSATGRWRFALLVNDSGINDPRWRDAVLARLIERVRLVSAQD
jgi:D-alanyl-D-alanine carboxypeptidase/D-alanyl-D-alanine-endopeptidase (penicillin-binding protein 4)